MSDQEFSSGEMFAYAYSRIVSGKNLLIGTDELAKGKPARWEYLAARMLEYVLAVDGVAEQIVLQVLGMESDDVRVTPEFRMNAASQVDFAINAYENGQRVGIVLIELKVSAPFKAGDDPQITRYSNWLHDETLQSSQKLETAILAVALNADQLVVANAQYEEAKKNNQKGDFDVKRKWFLWERPSGSQESDLKDVFARTFLENRKNLNKCVTDLARFASENSSVTLPLPKPYALMRDGDIANALYAEYELAGKLREVGGVSADRLELRTNVAVLRNEWFWLTSSSLFAGKECEKMNWYVDYDPSWVGVRATYLIHQCGAKRGDRHWAEDRIYFPLEGLLNEIPEEAAEEWWVQFSGEAFPENSSHLVRELRDIARNIAEKEELQSSILRSVPGGQRTERNELEQSWPMKYSSAGAVVVGVYTALAKALMDEAGKNGFTAMCKDAGFGLECDGTEMFVNLREWAFNHKKGPIFVEGLPILPKENQSFGTYVDEVKRVFFAALNQA